MHILLCLGPKQVQPVGRWWCCFLWTWFFYTNEHSVLQCMWHLLRTFLQHISTQHCPVSLDKPSLSQPLWSRIGSSKGIRMALLACCMFSISSSSEFISCTWAVFTSSIAFEQTFGMVSSGESVAESVERARCHGDSLEIICGESSSYNSPVRCTLYYNVISFEHSCDVSHRMQANNISENQQCALRNLCTWAKHIQKHMLSKHFDGQRLIIVNAIKSIWKNSYFLKVSKCAVYRSRIWKKSYFLRCCKCVFQKSSALPCHLPVLSCKAVVQKMSGLLRHCLYSIRQVHDPEHRIWSPCQAHHDCARWWDKFSYSRRSIT